MIQFFCNLGINRRNPICNQVIQSLATLIDPYSNSSPTIDLYRKPDCNQHTANGSVGVDPHRNGRYHRTPTAAKGQDPLIRLNYGKLFPDLSVEDDSVLLRISL